MPGSINDGTGKLELWKRRHINYGSREVLQRICEAKCISTPKPNQSLKKYDNMHHIVFLTPEFKRKNK
jgi:hypothetical protein